MILLLLLTSGIRGGRGQFGVLFAELLTDHLKVFSLLFVSGKFCADVFAITTASVATGLGQGCTSAAGALRREGRHAHVLRVRRRLSTDFALVASLNAGCLV